MAQDKDIILDAVKNNGIAIKYLKEESIDFDVAYESVNSSPLSI